MESEGTSQPTIASPLTSLATGSPPVVMAGTPNSISARVYSWNQGYRDGMQTWLLVRSEQGKRNISSFRIG
jgi:hypothetical protein